jgi:hypothetical protein
MDRPAGDECVRAMAPDRGTTDTCGSDERQISHAHHHL